MASSWADAIQNVLTRGLDAAERIKVAEAQASTANYDVVGPDGRTVARAGQPYTGMLSNVSPAMLGVGAAVLAVLVIVLVKKL